MTDLQPEREDRLRARERSNLEAKDRRPSAQEELEDRISSLVRGVMKQGGVSPDREPRIRAMARIVLEEQDRYRNEKAQAKQNRLAAIYAERDRRIAEIKEKYEQQRVEMQARWAEYWRKNKAFWDQVHARQISTAGMSQEEIRLAVEAMP